MVTHRVLPSPWPPGEDWLDGRLGTLALLALGLLAVAGVATLWWPEPAAVAPPVDRNLVDPDWDSLPIPSAPISPRTQPVPLPGWDTLPMPSGPIPNVTRPREVPGWDTLPVPSGPMVEAIPDSGPYVAIPLPPAGEALPLPFDAEGESHREEYGYPAAPRLPYYTPMAIPHTRIYWSEIRLKHVAPPAPLQHLASVS